MNAIPSIQVGHLVQEEDETSILKKMKPHVPGIVTFADHSRPLPWSVTYHAVVMFADISGFTALCEKYSTDGKSGVDQLTRTLNEYLSALVEGILGSDGDILKFAGDAILAIWRVGRIEELNNEITKVVQCCLDIQDKCGEWNTDIGIKLTVKIGLSAGEMSVTFLGNQEYRHYVELGPAVTAVNAAEHFCQAGMIVMSPDMFQYCKLDAFQTDTLEDGKHRRVCSLEPVRRKRSASLPVPNLLGSVNTDGPVEVLQKSHSDKGHIGATKLPPLISKVDVSQEKLDNKTETPDVDKRPLPLIVAETVETSPTPNTNTVVTNAQAETQPKERGTVKTLVKSKMKLGSKFGKLRKVVETVTEMRLDIALRLYILSPVLKKLDDNQPLEYLSEMRQVSIVFMNLVISDYGDTKDLLQKIFETVYSKSKAMNGCLNKVFLFDKGCTFLVLFGLPGYKHENDCAHALICSGRMKSQLETLSGIHRVSIGVTTGTTFCGVVGHPKRHEYSGRKVNMAARLMTHYPGKITCDTDTHQTCRLPPTFFDVLITKRMKGLRNVGVIREFIGFSKDENRVAKSIAHSDYPMLGRQMDEYQFRCQIAHMNTRQHIIYNGPSGIGKTKLLDEIITIAVDKNFRVVSCRVDLEDSSYPYFVANHILRGLLSNNGYSHQIEKEPRIVDALGDNFNYLYLLNDIMGSEIQKPLSLTGEKINEKAKRREVLRIIAKLCLESEVETVVVIDDAHNIDSHSWEFMCELLHIRQALIVLSLRPSIIEVPTCREAAYFIEHKDVKLFDLGSLDLNFLAPLACQMIDVVSIPKDLDKLLRERSHGVPTWCMEILKDMLDKKQLIVVLDDGSLSHSQPCVAPNKLLIKPRSSFTNSGRPSETCIRSLLHVDVTETEAEIEPGQETEVSFLSDLGYIHGVASSSYRDIRMKNKELGAGYAFGNTLTVPTIKQTSDKELSKSKKTKDVRIAIFAKGIIPMDIPVPASMKELIIARLDSMRSSDQLLVKCAAVLGKTVRRDILEMLLPKAHRPKLIRTVRRLIESGFFQCGNTPVSYLQKGTKDESGYQKYRCFCHKDDVQTRPGDLEACFEPSFTNNMLQQTAYEVLMETQRLELHTKAAHYFELSADEIRRNIPYYILYRSPDESLEDTVALMEAINSYQPAFTNMLQQTAYEVLMETQRLELHTKAAHYFELSADEIRRNIPYYILYRSPDESLEDTVALMEEFVPRKARRTRNKVSDEMYEQMASEARARRGRRQAVSMSAEDAVPMVHKIIEHAKPLESIQHQVEMLIPIYENLIFHWKHANNTWKMVHVMLETIPALTLVQKNAKALEMIESAHSLLTELKAENDGDWKVLMAKLHRLHGKKILRQKEKLLVISSFFLCLNVFPSLFYQGRQNQVLFGKWVKLESACCQVLYNSGRILEAYNQIKSALSMLDVKLNKKSTKYSSKWMWKFFIHWKLGSIRRVPMDDRSLEEGYCLHDLFIMYKDLESEDGMFRIAVQHFIKVVGRTVHLHQAVNAYSAMIECCRNKNWLDSAQTLELELLQSCATRHSELSSDDRSILATIFTKSCIQFFLDGDLEKADVSGTAAVEICLSIRDRETVKYLVPYYCHLCIYRKVYLQCSPMLQHLKYAAQLTDNHAAKVLYYTLCLELSMVDESSPETTDCCFESLAKQLKTCDAAATEIPVRYYAAMTAALCCAQKGLWKRMQVWFDYWEIYEMEHWTFFSAVGRINKIEGMIYSLAQSYAISNKTIIAQLKPVIVNDLRFVRRCSKTFKVLQDKVADIRMCYNKLLKYSKPSQTSQITEEVSS